MKTILLTVDLEEFDLPEIYNKKINEKEKFDISYLGALKLLKLLDKFKINATFFTTTSFAKKYPKLIKKISKIHEIALHAYDHKDDYSLMNIRKTYERLKKGKEIIEKISKKLIYGFRCPRFRSIDENILKKLNLKYDSSINPIYLPGNYFNIHKKRKIHYKNGMVKIPMSASPILRLPLSWIFFRNFGNIYNKFITRLCLLDQDFINLDFHPWEFVNIKEFVPLKQWYASRNTGNKLLKTLKNYIIWCKKKNFKFNTIYNYLKSSGI